MVQKFGNFLTNREHAPNGYISFMLRQYIDTPKGLAWLGDKDQTKKLREIKIWIINTPISVRIAWWRRGLLFRQYIDAEMLFPWIVYRARTKSAVRE
jgi:hypothetical protein